MELERTKWWESKFKANVKRDLEIQEKIKNIGWQSVVIWECELTKIQYLKDTFLNIKN